MAIRQPRVTKTPQCRHSERQGFVTYETSGETVRALCANCASVSAYMPTREGARNDLMKIEAAPLVP